MSDSLTFPMGKFTAVLPGDLRYARNHMWARSLGPGPAGTRWQFGFTSYAIRLMKDVYFLDWNLSAGDSVELLQEIGHIETSKAESDLFSPLAGVLTTFNTALLNDPSAINVDGYGAGWLFEIETGDDSVLLEPGVYLQFLADNWEKTQRHIKGRINAEE
jgi:glycine cleavage system H protein